MEKQMEQKIKPEEQKRHLIKAYLDDEEYEKFQLFAKACKCTNSNFVRELLAGATLIEFPPKDYLEIKNQLYRVAININQLARVANAQGYVDVDEYRKQADLLMRIGAEMSMFVSYCGAQLNSRLYEPSPFLTNLLKKYDVEAKEGKGKHDHQGNAQ